MTRLLVTRLPLAGLMRVQRQRFADERGFLARVFCAQELSDAGWRKPVAQINHSHTRHRATVRGMHFQTAPHTEMKLVTCLRGRVFDVAVDLRHGSATFGRWHGEELSAEGGTALLLPEGFAHGFQALTDDVELLYCHSEPYAAGAEAGIQPLDPRLGIAWPLPPVRLSPRDQSLPGLDQLVDGVLV